MKGIKKNLNIKKYQSLITKFFKPKVEISNYHCLECGIDMGNYPGQLCRKWYCDGIYY